MHAAQCVIAIIINKSFYSNSTISFYSNCINFIAFCILHSNCENKERTKWSITDFLISFSDLDLVPMG